MKSRILKNFFSAKRKKLRKASTNALTWSGMLVPVNVSMSYFNYGVSAAAGGIFALTGHMDLGTPCLLSGLCASERDALKSVYKPVQLSSGGSLRCRADF